jgi:hypothetical protein
MIKSFAFDTTEEQKQGMCFLAPLKRGVVTGRCGVRLIYLMLMYI